MAFMQRLFTAQNILGFALFALAALVFQDAAFAQAAQPGVANPNTCTTDPAFNIPSNLTIITSIIDSFSCILYGGSGCGSTGLAEIMFNNIIANGGFSLALRAAVMLYVIIYGMGFALGFLQVSILDFCIRAFKLGVVIALLTPTAWIFFYSYVGLFFKNGTDEIIHLMTQIAVGGIAGVDPSKPFSALDATIGILLSGKMLVTLLAMFLTGPYGLLFALLLALGLGTFMAAMLQALWIYIMSLVVRAFLFGLAPIFISFLLFSRTRHLFDGWLNQLVNASLQPIFLFAFFAFFVELIRQAMLNILKVPVCYMPMKGLWRGTPFDEVLPRFAKPSGLPAPNNWEPYAGSFEWNMPFPISIVDILIFVILVQLAWRFNGVVIHIAQDIAGASTSLNMSGAFSEWMTSSPSSNFNAGQAKLIDRISGRANPGAGRAAAAAAEGAAGGGAGAQGNNPVLGTQRPNPGGGQPNSKG